MSSRNNLFAAALLAASAAALAIPAPAALADELVFDPAHPGYHPGSPAYYHRYWYYPDWFDRRDTITLQAGDAVATNQAVQMRDPWPPYVGNRNIPFNGVVMDGAIDRYEAGTVYEPEHITTTIE